MSSETISLIALGILPVILAITLHEAAHGWAANFFGDDTALRQGRVSMNPLVHIDLVGTIVLPLFLLITSGGQMMFGWAKPVPVRTSRLRNPVKDMAWVAAAGPISNIAMTLAWGLIFKFVVPLVPESFTTPLETMATIGILSNIVLAVLNALPIPPLDGSKVLMGLGPSAVRQLLMRLDDRHGLILLLILMVTGILGDILRPIINAFINLLNFLL